MFKLTILGLILINLSLWTKEAHAACIGSGLVYNCSAGTTTAEVQAAIDNASDGGKVLFAPGSYSWNSWINFSNSKGVTLQCQTLGACNINVTGTVLGMNGNCGGDNTKLYRISGFKFIGGNQSVIWFNSYTTGRCTLSKVRIDNNIFVDQAAGTILILFGDSSRISQFYGLIDHNQVTNNSSIAMSEIISGVDPLPLPAGTRGTAMNMYYEDNVVNILNMTNTGVGCVDSWGSGSIVWRHNTTTNCAVASHGVTHSWGPINWEVYSNHFRVNAGATPSVQNCYRCFHHQGSGEIMAYDNDFTAYSGKSANALALTHYRSATPEAAGYSIAGRCDGTDPVDGNRPGMMGYPCKRQPGRDVNGKLNPIYIWKNRWSDTGDVVDLIIENPWGQSNPSVNDHIKPNRDYYSAVSASPQSSPNFPFNGTVGMGFGTLANRPVTCTTNASEANGGVGYFAVDSGPQGTLYRCSATNVWSVQYVPFTYPHPLTEESSEPTPLPSPSPSPLPSPSPSPLPSPSPSPTPISVDIIPPVVTIISPINNGFVTAGELVKIKALESDNVGVKKVDFYVNGKLICTNSLADTDCSWRVPQRVITKYIIEVRAYDSIGNIGKSNISVYTRKHKR